MERKKIKEWLEQLDEPYKSQALSNASEDMLKQSATNLKEALSCAFKWSETEQGFNYWFNLYNYIELKSTNPVKYNLITIARKLKDAGDKADQYLNGKLSDQEFDILVEQIKKEII